MKSLSNTADDGITQPYIDNVDYFLSMLRPIEFKGTLYRARVIDLDKDLDDNKGIVENQLIKGLNERESGRPPVIYSKAGRANHEWESIWYFADDKVTALLEVKPSIRQCVSLAEFRYDDSLRLIDFSRSKGKTWAELFNEEQIKEDGEELRSCYADLCWLFSKPYEEAKDYYITNIIKERCKKLENVSGRVDGIVYKSFYGCGRNFAIWNTDKKAVFIDSNTYINYCTNTYFVSLNEQESLNNDQYYLDTIKNISSDDIEDIKSRIIKKYKKQHK